MSETTASKLLVIMSLTGVLVGCFARPGAAQKITLGGGVNAGSVPRALEPLCGSARRLKGVGLSGRAGLATNPVRFDASLDYVARIGVRDMASCIPRPPGISVDSAFADAGNSAATLGIAASIPLHENLAAGVGAGWVLSHSSWFIGPVIGAQFWKLRVEAQARRHVTSFDEVTYETGASGTRELSRRESSESSWGGIVRILLVARQPE